MAVRKRRETRGIQFHFQGFWAGVTRPGQFPAPGSIAAAMPCAPGVDEGTIRCLYQLDEVSTWSSRGFSSYYLQTISAANLKGLGHFFMTTAALTRAP